MPSPEYEGSIILQLVEAIHDVDENDGRPLVVAVPELPEYELVRMRAERLIRFAGAAAIHGTAEQAQPDGYASLRDAIIAAKTGDGTARKVVIANALSDVVERTIKAGHVMRVPLQVDAYGRLMQHGQLMDNVFVNALRYTSRDLPMRARTEAEIHNGMWVDSLRRQGVLQEYAFVVVSRCPDDMTDQVAAQAGFFMDTKTCAIQVISEEDGELFQESAFVAGTPELGCERRDRQAANGMAQELGVEYTDHTATGMLRMPLLVHKSLMPRGVIDLVEKYDRCAGGTFFGQAKPPQDYDEYLQYCRNRELELRPTAEEVVRRLLVEADQLRSPDAAVRRLHEISQARLVDLAFADTGINPRVFGDEAAQYIEAGRVLLVEGDLDRFLEMRSQAQRTARSSSCPAEFKGIGDDEELGIDGQSDGSDEDCEFVSKECPMCGAKNVKTVVTKGYIIGNCGCKKKKV